MSKSNNFKSLKNLSIKNNSIISYLVIFITFVLSVSYLTQKKYNALILLYLIAGIIYLIYNNIVLALVISIIITNILISYNIPKKLLKKYKHHTDKIGGRGLMREGLHAESVVTPPTVGVPETIATVISSDDYDNEWLGGFSSGLKCRPDKYFISGKKYSQWSLYGNNYQDALEQCREVWEENGLGNGLWIQYYGDDENSEGHFNCSMFKENVTSTELEEDGQSAGGRNSKVCIPFFN